MDFPITKRYDYKSEKKFKEKLKNENIKLITFSNKSLEIGSKKTKYDNYDIFVYKQQYILKYYSDLIIKHKYVYEIDLKDNFKASNYADNKNNEIFGLKGYFDIIEAKEMSEYLKSRDYRFYYYGIEENIRTYYYIPNFFWDYNIYLKLIQCNKQITINIPKEFIDEKMVTEIFKNKYIKLDGKTKNKIYEVIEHMDKNKKRELVKYNWKLLEKIPKNEKNYEIYLDVCECDEILLENIPERYRTYELCLKFLSNKKKIKYEEFVKIPKNIIDKKIINIVTKMKLIDVYMINYFTKTNGTTLEYLKEYFEDLIDEENYRNVIKSNGMLINYIPEKFIDYNICLEAVKENGESLNNIPKKIIDYNICLEAVKNKGITVKYVPDNIIDKEICFEAVKSDGESFVYIPDKHREEIFFEISEKYSDCLLNYNVIGGGCGYLIIKISNNSFNDIVLQRLFINNILNDHKITESLLKKFFKHLNIKEIVKGIMDSKNYYDNKKLLNKQINQIYKKIKEIHPELVYDIKKLFDVIINFDNDKEKNIYMTNNFIDEEILFKFIEKKKRIYEFRFETICDESFTLIYDSSMIELNKNKIDKLIKNKNKYILVEGRQKIKSINLEQVNELYNITSNEYNIIYKDNYYNITNHDDKINYGKAVYNGLLESNFSMTELFLIYFDRYLNMKNNNFNHKLKFKNNPDSYLLKKAKYLPIYLKEFLIYEKNKKIKIDDLRNDFKKYVSKSDLALSKKITKKNLIDCLLEFEEFKNNLSKDNSFLFNYETNKER
jgi:hypothetical protein